ncbi:hypothetical protein SLEP1_g15940 [Rubroshorea leprosula]|uniref:Uncharacterized protein n=1 Tax=Rubroshorea leprosula TaxID=152421 RepID=A0AAV5IY08_9ROSI|nr:hypothetical protein SLEP1_g15940 [Rubroshorea leprosula]
MIIASKSQEIRLLPGNHIQHFILIPLVLELRLVLRGQGMVRFYLFTTLQQWVQELGASGGLGPDGLGF